MAPLSDENAAASVSDAPQHRRHDRRSRSLLDAAGGRWIRRLVISASIASVLGASSGCMVIRGVRRSLTRCDEFEEFVLDYRNRAWSARAWLHTRDQFAGHPYLGDLEAGFRAGYEEVAAGGPGCTPTVCPSSYWGWQYQTVDGQSRMDAWFEGYPLGVRAAQMDGVGHFGGVVMPTLAASHSGLPPGAPHDETEQPPHPEAEQAPLTDGQPVEPEMIGPGAVEEESPAEPPTVLDQGDDVSAGDEFPPAVDLDR